MTPTQHSSDDLYKTNYTQYYHSYNYEPFSSPHYLTLLPNDNICINCVIHQGIFLENAFHHKYNSIYIATNDATGHQNDFWLDIQSHALYLSCMSHNNTPHIVRSMVTKIFSLKLSAITVSIINSSEFTHQKCTMCIKLMSMSRR